MKSEDKELLVRDLSGRLPYGVIINIHDTYPYTRLPYFNICLNSFVSILSSIEPIFKTKDKLIKMVLKKHAEYLEFRPFLRSMSSITKEEYEEETTLFGRNIGWEHYDWLNKKMFDYRGLIAMGLAIEAPEGIYN